MRLQVGTSPPSSRLSSSYCTAMTALPSAESVSTTWCHTVRCATDTSWTALESPIPLGPLDQIIDATIPIAVVFVYEQPSSKSDARLIPLERLERAMSHLLDNYPHLSGRLQVNALDGTAEIVGLGTGVYLFAAKCNERLDAFNAADNGLIMNLPEAGNALLPPFDATIDGVCREPMFAIQHTRFACGSVALGVRVLHRLCDAHGFFQLVRDLAELYRGDGNPIGTPTLSHPPHCQSYLSGFSEETITREEKEAILAFQPPLFHFASAETSSMMASTTMPAVIPPPNVGRFMRFSTRELNALKSAATNPSHPGSWVSTFEALSAHLYHHIHLARLRLRQDKEATAKYGELSFMDFLTPFNLRLHDRLDADSLPSKYFPNASMCIYTHIPPNILADGPLYKIANILHEMTRNPPGITSQADIARTSKWIALQQDKRRIRQGFRYGSGSFVVSQWNKIDMYEGTAFDCSPMLVSPSFAPMFLMDGLAVFLPTADQAAGVDRGAIEVGLALSEPVWGILDQDQEFRRFRDV